MVLRSITFKDDAALQKCLLHDSAHVVPGSVGPHVARIQSALLLLDQARINPAELYSKHYGPTTTAAVLAYKRKRKIINFSYQSQADNIVGKMTIARMDEDILAVERGPATRAVCPSGGRASGAPRAVASQPAAIGDSQARVRFNRQCRLIFQATSLAEAFGGMIQLPALMRRARVLMTPHGLGFADELPRIGATIPHDQLVDVHFHSEAFALRQKSVLTMPAPDNVLRVIFCPFANANPYFGSTHGGMPVDGMPEVPKFVLINISRSHDDAGTLLHEMIHASVHGNSLPHDDDIPRSVYSTADGGRDQFPDKRAKQVAEAYFSRP
jgi:hypothetical protein